MNYSKTLDSFRKISDKRGMSLHNRMEQKRKSDPTGFDKKIFRCSR